MIRRLVFAVAIASLFSGSSTRAFAGGTGGTSFVGKEPPSLHDPNARS